MAGVSLRGTLGSFSDIPSIKQDDFLKEKLTFWSVCADPQAYLNIYHTQLA